jgi:nucleotide-binding universal stress UspA family protein
MNPLPRTILVSTDFGEAAGEALEYGVAWARLAGAKLTLLHVCEIPYVGSPDGALVPTGDVVEQMLQDAERLLAALAANYAEQGVVVTPLVEQGNPRDVICAVARRLGAGLIVMGTHGRRGLSHAFLGSVAEWVVRMAPCPVLTIHNAPAREKPSRVEAAHAP